MKNILIISILIAITLFVGCGKIVNPVFEDQLVKVLNKNSKADKWTCKLTGNPNLATAFVPKVNVDGENVVYHNSIIKEVHATFENVRVDVKKQTIKSCDKATANIIISDKEMSKIIQNNISTVKSPEVVAKDGAITIKGAIDVLSFDVNLEVTGNLTIENGIDFMLIPSDFKIMRFGINIPNWSKDTISKIINPVFEIKNNEYGIYLDSLTYKKGYIEATGEFDSVKVLEAFKEKNIKDKP